MKAIARAPIRESCCIHSEGPLSVNRIRSARVGDRALDLAEVYSPDYIELCISAFTTMWHQCVVRVVARRTISIVHDESGARPAANGDAWRCPSQKYFVYTSLNLLFFTDTVTYMPYCCLVLGEFLIST